MKKLIIITLAAVSLLAACQREPAPAGEGRLVLSVSAEPTLKTAYGEEASNQRPVYWTNGDQMALNGTASAPLSGLEPEATSASFSFSGSFSSPYRLLYPASLYKSASQITLPATQTWASGNAVALPLAAQPSALTGSISMNHLCATVQLKVKKNPAVSAANLATVTFKGNSGEQVCGDFSINYSTATLTPAGDGEEFVLNVDQPLDESEALNLFLVVPEGTFADGFSVVLEDALHRTMVLSTNAITLTKGHIKPGKAFLFTPSDFCSELELDDDIEEEIIKPAGYNVKGRVVDASTNKGLEGVVVSDGLQCVRTFADGSFYMKSTLAKTKFVWVSTPSGYLPPVVNGIPQYYKAKADVTPSGGIYDFGTYSLTPDGSADPNHFTLFMTADPQSRANPDEASTIFLDNCAYRSWRCQEDLTRILKETAATISGQNIYGICLGDLVHENMPLMTDYAGELATLGFPTYNVIGNHDADPAGTDDDSGSAPFEALFGPRNYSFNIGGLHFIVLDDIMMKFDSYGDLKAYDYGLTDDVMAWLEADLSYIPTSTTLMVCSHAPMFRVSSSSEHSNTFNHGPDYGALFDKYAEVHAWAGHTHETFNYNYPDTHRHKNIQVHTLARSTGQLWTNEYLCSCGTPRGFTVVEVNNGAITWKFHPTPYQKAAYQASSICAEPSYTYRDWNYVSKVAKMKDTGNTLDDSYQMHVYAPGVYQSGYVYANIFLWDDKWGTPTFSLNGGTPVDMENVPYTETGSCDYGAYEFSYYYKQNNSRVRALGSSYVVRTSGLHTIFKTPCSAASGTGTVSVTDRFGNTFTRTISW